MPPAAERGITPGMERVIIERLGHHGDGIAPGPIFVPGALPGEEVEGTVAEGVMQTPRILTPSTDRVKPPCRHARACGGCQLQHAAPAFTASWKQEIVRRALAAQGLEAELPPVLTSPPKSRRRATFSARRTKSGALAGFHRHRSDIVITIPDCEVLHPEITAALPLAEALAIAGGSRKGELSVSVTRTETDLDVVVSGGKPADARLRETLAEIARAHDLARLSWGTDETLTRRRPVLRIGRAAVTPPPGSFLQATPDGETALQHAVTNALSGATRIADLFAGVGTFALPLAERAEVHAVEGEADMLAALDAGWRGAAGVKRVTTETRDLFRNPLLGPELARFDGVVIDPPRAGAEAQVTELARARVPVIAHVSCNPATFAREARTLVEAGYRMGPVQVVDQFRWSVHVELVAAFSLTEL